jgi:hypothetical protein
MGKERASFVNTEAWYTNLVGIAGLPPAARYNALTELHADTISKYLSQINSITDSRALQRSSDGRTIKDVVAHIMAWEDWQIQNLTDPDIKSRLEEGVDLKGYRNEDGARMDFKNDDEFNAYVTDRYKTVSWNQIKTGAVQTALKLQSLFPKKALAGWIDFLESTPLYPWKLPNTTLPVPTGWFVWMISLEHEAIEHRTDLEGHD